MIQLTFPYPPPARSSCQFVRHELFLRKKNYKTSRLPHVPPSSRHVHYPPWNNMIADVESHQQGRKKSVAEEPVTSVLGGDTIPSYTRELDRDEEVLAALGYKPEFRREFSLWTTFCVSFAVLGLLPSFAATLYYVSFSRFSADGSPDNAPKGMGYAGTPGMVWGWLIAILFIQCVAMSMAELCSSMPTSGGLYYAAAVSRITR